MVNPVVKVLIKELTNQYTKDLYPELNRNDRKKKELERLKKISWSAKLIKLCDRYDNVRDMRYNCPDLQIASFEDFYYFQETRDMIEAFKNIAGLENIIAKIEDVIDGNDISNHFKSVYDFIDLSIIAYDFLQSLIETTEKQYD